MKNQMLIFFSAILSAMIIVFAAPANAGFFDKLANKLNSLSVGVFWDQIDPSIRDCLEQKTDTPIKKLKANGDSPYDMKFDAFVDDCYGQAGPPRLGVRLAQVSDRISTDIVNSLSSGGDTTDVTGVTGARTLVTEVLTGSVAEQAGIQSGDVIYSFLNSPIYKDELLRYVKLANTGTPQKISVWRRDEFVALSLSFPSKNERLALSEEFQKEQAAKREAELAEQKRLAEESAKRKKAEAAKRKKAAEQAKKRAKARAKQTAEANQKLIEHSDFNAAASELFSGHENDVIYLLNTKSEGITRGLSGDFVLTQKSPSSCYIEPSEYDPNSDEFYRTEHSTTIKKLKLSTLSVSKCKPLSKEPSHILILTNKIQTSMDTARLKWVLERFNSGEYKLVHVSDYAKLEADRKAAKQETAARVREIEEGVLAGTKRGFGLFRLTNSSDMTCIENTEVESVKRILGEGGVTNVEVNSLESIFVKMKTNECGGFFGKHNSLKILADALKRDDVNYEFFDYWLTPSKFQTKVNQYAAQEKAARERKARESEAKRRAAQEKAEREKAAKERVEQLFNVKWQMFKPLPCSSTYQVFHKNSYIVFQQGRETEYKAEYKINGDGNIVVTEYTPINPKFVGHGKYMNIVSTYEPTQGDILVRVRRQIDDINLDAFLEGRVEFNAPKIEGRTELKNCN